MTKKQHICRHDPATCPYCCRYTNGHHEDCPYWGLPDDERKEIDEMMLEASKKCDS